MAPPVPPRAASKDATPLWASQPLAFEPNVGQTSSEARFLARGDRFVMLLSASGLAMNSARGTPLRMLFVGSNKSAEITPAEPLPGRSNYLLGRDPAKWRLNVPHYRRVVSRDIYPGIDLVYYGKGRTLEYDFVVAPGSDPRSIQLSFEGAEVPYISAEGDLVLRTASGEIRHTAPVVYQDVRGQRREVRGKYVQQGRIFRFAIGPYDRTSPLVIDPVLVYSSYLGGPGDDLANDVALDASGNIYVVGQATSVEFPVQADAMIAQLSPDGSVLLNVSYIGGSVDDRVNGIALDILGNVYVTGRTSSEDFPVTAGAFQQSFGGGTFDAFVAKLTTDALTPVYVSYLGGFLNDAAFDVAVDATGSAYVTGGTGSNDFPVGADSYQRFFGGGQNDAFVTRFNDTGDSLIFSTFVGGSFRDRSNSIAIDSSGNVHITGWTESPDFPTASPLQEWSGLRDAFVTALTADGTTALFSTLWGGTTADGGLALALGVDDAVYITGYTESDDFQVINAAQAIPGGIQDAFAVKFSAGGVAVEYSTFLGGSNAENAVLAPEQSVGSIAVDAEGKAFVTGSTRSVDFPIVSAVQDTLGGMDDAFLAVLSPTGDALVHATYLGGSQSDLATGIALDIASAAYVVGQTYSTDFPLVNPIQPALAGEGDAFIFVVTPDYADETEGDAVRSGARAVPRKIAATAVPSQKFFRKQKSLRRQNSSK